MTRLSDASQDASTVRSCRLPVNATAGVLLLIGIAFRLRAYLANRSLWLDEAMLALNLLKRPFQGLLSPLDHDQAAPIGFLLLEKLAVVCFGGGEMSLRLVPLLASVAALPLFLILALRLLDCRAALIATGCIAVASPFAYFASEVKPYSLDVLMSILVLLVASLVVQEGPSWRRLTVLAIVGGLATWFSYPAIFVVAGAGVVVLVNEIRRGGRRWFPVAAIAIASLASFALNFLLFTAPTASHPPLLSYWEPNFAPRPAASFAFVEWYVRAFHDAFSSVLSPQAGALAGAGFLLGAAAFYQRSRTSWWLLLLPLSFLAVGTLLRKYPFDARLVLFAAPIWLIILAAGISALWDIRMGRISVGLVMLLVLAAMPAYRAMHTFRFPRQREELRPVLEHVRQHSEPGDLLYVYAGAQHAFDYYSALDPSRYAPQADMTLIYGKRFEHEWARYRQDLEQLDGHPRVWVVFSHVHDWSDLNEERLLVFWLDQMGHRLGAHTAVGAAAYLFDLSE